MKNLMTVGVLIEDRLAVMVMDTGTMMTLTIVVVRMEDHQMVAVVDQLPAEIQAVDLMIVEMEVAAQGVLVAGHHLHNLLTVGEAVVKIEAKAHQQEAIAHHQAMEEELVVRKVLLQGAKKHHVDQQRENRASALFSYLLNSKSFLCQSIQKKLEKKLKK